MADEKELWTRLCLRTSGAEVWTREPLLAVSDAIQKRHPIKIESGEYIHPDEIARFFPYENWKKKEEERERLSEAALQRTLNELAKEKTGTKKRRWR